MPDLDELLSDLDDDAKEAVKKLIAEKDAVTAKDKATMARDLKLRTDPMLREKYPRAIRAYQAEDFTLPEDASEDALLAALKSKEAKLEAQGVPAALATPAKEGGEVDDDPAGAWAGASRAQGPGTLEPESAEPKLRKLIEDGGTTRQFVDAIHGMHKEGRRGLRSLHDITEDYMAEAHPDSVVL